LEVKVNFKASKKKKKKKKKPFKASKNGRKFPELPSQKIARKIPKGYPCSPTLIDKNKSINFESFNFISIFDAIE
jgi:hypothetical protein